MTSNSLVNYEGCLDTRRCIHSKIASRRWADWDLDTSWVYSTGYDERLSFADDVSITMKTLGAKDLTYVYGWLE